MTNRISARFAELARRGEKAFVAYITAGDPSLQATVDIVQALAEAGVDVVELGFPYSDPMADGQAIQDAAGRAIAAGATVGRILESVATLRRTCQVPLLAFTYLSPVVAYGQERFARDAAAAGLDGVLPLDLPIEEDDGFLPALKAQGLVNVCLVAPNTVPERRKKLAAAGSGFIYYVCRYGVTGERSELPKDLARQVKDLKRHAQGLPVCVGFGISTPEQAATAAGFADGAVVGSHLVKEIARLAQDPGLAAAIGRRAKAFVSAVRTSG